MPFITQGKTNLKYVLIIVILAVIVGGGIWGYYYLWIRDLETKLAELEVRVPEKVIKDETADLSSEASATEDWKTYRNEEYGYEIKYPGDWIVFGEESNKYFISKEGRAWEEKNERICRGEEEGICAPDMPPSGFFVDVEENTGSKTLEDLRKELVNSVSSEDVISKIKSNGVPGIKLKTYGLAIDLYAFFVAGSYIYTITYLMGDEEGELFFDQIFSTFKFIE